MRFFTRKSPAPHPGYAIFTPREDITPFELAKILQAQCVNVSLGWHDKLGPDVRRHFTVIKSAGEI